MIDPIVSETDVNVVIPGAELGTTYSKRFDGKVRYKAVSYTKDDKTVYGVKEIVSRETIIENVGPVDEELYVGLYELSATEEDAVDRAFRLNQEADFFATAEKTYLVPPKELI